MIPSSDLSSHHRRTCRRQVGHAHARQATATAVASTGTSRRGSRRSKRESCPTCDVVTYVMVPNERRCYRYGVGEFSSSRSVTQRASSGKLQKKRSAKARRSTPAGTLITGTTTSLSMSLDPARSQRPPVRGIHGVKSGIGGRHGSPSVSPRRPRADSASRREDKRVARRGPQAMHEGRGAARTLERFNSEPTTSTRR